MNWKLFYYINELEIILLHKWTGNYITIKMNWKLFYYKNVLKIILQKIQWNLYCYKNALDIISYITIFFTTKI